MPFCAHFSFCILWCLKKAAAVTILFSLCQTKAEERKLLSHRMESFESDQDETPNENQLLNKENKAKDKTERLDKLLILHFKVICR